MTMTPELTQDLNTLEAAVKLRKRVRAAGIVGTWQFLWRLVARNGRTLASSEIYWSRDKCRETAALIAAVIGVEVVEK